MAYITGTERTSGDVALIEQIKEQQRLYGYIEKGIALDLQDEMRADDPDVIRRAATHTGNMIGLGRAGELR